MKLSKYVLALVLAAVLAVCFTLLPSRLDSHVPTITETTTPQNIPKKVAVASGTAEVKVVHIDTQNRKQPHTTRDSSEAISSGSDNGKVDIGPNLDADDIHYSLNETVEAVDIGDDIDLEEFYLGDQTSSDAINYGEGMNPDDINVSASFDNDERVNIGADLDVNFQYSHLETSSVEKRDIGEDIDLEQLY